MEWKSLIYSPLDVMALQDEFGVIDNPKEAARKRRDSEKKIFEAYKTRVVQGEDGGEGEEGEEGRGRNKGVHG